MNEKDRPDDNEARKILQFSDSSPSDHSLSRSKILELVESIENESFDYEEGDEEWMPEELDSISDPLHQGYTSLRIVDSQAGLDERKAPDSKIKESAGTVSSTSDQDDKGEHITRPLAKLLAFCEGSI